MRNLVRWILNSLGLLLVMPWVLWARLGMAFRTEQTYSSAAFAISMAPGLVGILMRRGFYALTLTRSHWDFSPHFGTVVTHPTTTVGRNVWVGAYCLIGRSEIEDDVIVASRVSVLSGRRPHRFDDPDRPIQDQAGEFVAIRIGKDCWLGEGCIVMADIGPGAVVGAGAVVVKPVPKLAVVAGNPAKQINTRGAAKP